MKAIALIPARYNASRFPGKLMAKLGDKSVILRTYEAARATELFDEVVVVTDSDIIYKEITENGGKAIMSLQAHETGSDRIAEAAEQLEADVILNVQGDEPFIRKAPLAALLNVFEKDQAGEIDLASLMQPLTSAEHIEDPNNVKVVVDKQSNALLFSRSPIPYHRNDKQDAAYFKHIGVYAFRKQALIDFKNTSITPLENIEKIEALRYLEIGKKIRMVQSGDMGIAIDSPKDLEEAKAFLG